MGGDVISPYGKPAQDKGTLDNGIQRYKYAQSQNSGLELEDASPPSPV